MSHEQSLDQWHHARANSCRSLTNRSNSLHWCHPPPRKRVHSAHYPISPLSSRGSHQYLQSYHQRWEDPLVAPLTSSMSASMITTPSTPSSATPELSPSSSSSSPALSAISTPPTTTIPPRRRRSASTSHVNQQQRKHNSHPDPSAALHPIQTRTPWTPTEDYLLQKGYEQGLSWAMISATHLPHRSRGCCWGRFKTLRSKNLIHVNIQQQSRLSRRVWKAVDMKKSATINTSLPSPLSPSSA
ncbi:hypothetical protein [Absidia glauca]|uniref:Myb-like domain-containing protein n=1 Tax=Absidia glauca TaxID=4829 RepID=A0A163MGT5_ABSGL|nr:hypothetical protein [Absidia glauca]